RAAKSAVEKHGVLAVEKFCDAAFEFAVEISHARKHGRAARAHPMSAQRPVRSGQDVGVISQTQIVVRAKVDHLPWLPGVVDRRPGICSREKLGLVQFNGPSAELHPVCKARWGLQRVVAFACEKIT